jgi:elongation of very long chain fatty acids protein 6
MDLSHAKTLTHTHTHTHLHTHNHKIYHRELIDTFFILIHKKPLILLHWYHHISVLAYCWHSYVTKAPAGIVFCAMNYAVHAIMYFYYFLMAVKCKPKWFNSMYITVSQISQMVVGVIVTALSFVMSYTYGPTCHIKTENNVAAFIMYGSYLLLFLQFFFKRYSAKKEKNIKKE